LFARIGEAYERIQVPAIFAPAAQDLLRTVALQPGERVLDVACGTGIVARLAAPQVGPSGQVAGLDLNEGMLAVARAQAASQGLPIEWHQGDATQLPFPDAAFDVVLCQQGLQFIADRRAALREMRRVLVPGGRAAVSTWQYREDHELWDRFLAGYVAPEVVSRIQARSPRIAREDLESELRAAGFGQVDAALRHLTARFASHNQFLEYQLTGRMASVMNDLSESAQAALLAEVRAALAAYRDGDEVPMPQRAYVALARP
jgi:ubiquinone/menaquinone biosynthesis C-methylase UbiE